MFAKIFFMVLYVLVSIFCFYIQTQEFSLMFLILGLLCIGLVVWNLKKMFAKSEEEDVEAGEKW